jgi:hypothetical protein
VVLFRSRAKELHHAPPARLRTCAPLLHSTAHCWGGLHGGCWWLYCAVSTERGKKQQSPAVRGFEGLAGVTAPLTCGSGVSLRWTHSIGSGVSGNPEPTRIGLDSRCFGPVCVLPAHKGIYSGQGGTHAYDQLDRARQPKQRREERPESRCSGRPQ